MTRDLPDLEGCEFLSSSPKYRILSVASRERQPDSSEILRRDSGEGQIKAHACKEEVTGGTFDLS